MQQITERYHSSKQDRSDPDPKYTTIIHSDGKIACNCRGWATKKLHQARTCTHCDQILSKHGLTAVDKGEFRYVKMGALGAPLSDPNAAPNVFFPPEKPKSKKLPVVVTEPVKKTRFNVIPETHEDAAQFVNPMLASPFPDGLTLSAFCSGFTGGLGPLSGWAMEEKFDGHRVIVTVNEGNVKAWSRPRAGKEALVRILPEQLAVAFSKLPTATYDGELMIPGGRSYNVTDGKFAGTEIFVVFDILSLLGMSTIRETYDARRAYLTEIFSRAENQNPFVKLAESSPVSLAAVEAIWARDGEGAIFKRRASCYQPGARSRDFIKVKNVGRLVMEVVGYEAAKLGPYAKVKLVGPNGEKAIVKTLDNDALRAFEANPDSFIGRKLMIEFQERTPDGSFRHPRWDRWENE